MTRLDLPSGAWADLADPQTLLVGDKKRILAAITDNTKTVQAGFEVCEALLARCITGWSYDLPLPSHAPDVLDRLANWDDYLALQNWALPVIGQLNTVAPTPDQALNGDPGSPTMPSNV